MVDYVTLRPNNTTIIGGDAPTYIENWEGSFVTIKGGKDNDNIYNRAGKNVSINSGAGSDYIYNETLDDWDYDADVEATLSPDNVTIDSGDDKDYVYNYGSKASISAGKGDDNIYNRGIKKVTILGGAGNDHISNYGAKVTIDGGTGNDYIWNYGANGSIVGGAGKDTISNDGAKASIDGGAGDDKIYNNGGSNVTIDAGAGNDEISNYGSGSNISIDAGVGNDSIYNNGENVTISNFSYGTYQVKLQIASGKFDSVVSTNGTDFFVNVGKNTITIKEALNNKIQIVNAKGKALNYSLKMVDNLFSSEDNVAVKGTQNRDFIQNSGDKAQVSGYAGDDVSITGVSGDDFIYNQDEKNVVFEYKSGNGNDLIKGFNATSTLNIAGKRYSTVKNYSDLIVTVDTSKITLQGAASLDAANIDFKKMFTVTDETASPVTVDAKTKIIDASTRTKQTEITGNKLANTISGGSKNDLIYGAAGNDSIFGSAGNDTLYGDDGKDYLKGGAGNDSLVGGAGKDTFIYVPGEGTDKIMDYASGDILKILDADGNNGSFKSSKYSGGDLTLTISGGGKVIFDDVSASTKFNINGTTYQISGSKLKKQ